VACVLRQIADALDVLRSGAAAEAVGIDESGTLSSHGLIIDGKSLLYIFEDDGAKAGFLQLAMLCDSVICCRVSPKQKSQVRPPMF
jgi:phospholipid-translocating ATPase